MYGLGAAAKRAIRVGRMQLSDWRLDRRAPDSLAFFRRLERDYYDPDHFWNVLESRNAIYIEVPKAACSTIKSALAYIETGIVIERHPDAHKRNLTHLKSPRDVGLERFHKMTLDPSAFVFTFVRNPYARVVSCWNDKLRDVPVGQPTQLLAELLQRPEAQGLRLDRHMPVPLRDFVYLAAATARARLNGHWSLIADIVPKDRVNFIGKVENFAADFAEVVRRIGAEAEMQQNPPRRMNQTSSTGLTDLLDREMLDTINRAYREDFARFGYTMR